MRIPNDQIVNRTSLDATGDEAGHVRTGEIYWTQAGKGSVGMSGRPREITGGTAARGRSAIAAAPCSPLAISTLRLRAGIHVCNRERQYCDTSLESNGK